ncbi:hypothetical protein [Rhizobium sp. FKY42]|uniref:hypothetical protein n=1 Tax=Rhizobium sp. FKY42 TaxID=2562310 RepID=UPI0010C0E1B6|nr:hypothetical protein [Rhizobium sp. FKY42]
MDSADASASEKPLDWPAELTVAIEQGLALGDFCKKHGVSPTTVRRMEYRTGLKLQRKRIYPATHAPGIGIDWPATLSEAKAEGLSVNQLAVRLFVTNASVLNAEDRTGIYLNRKRPSPQRQGGFRTVDTSKTIDDH